MNELLNYVKASTGFLGLDLLLTCMWPADVFFSFPFFKCLKKYVHFREMCTFTLMVKTK